MNPQRNILVLGALFAALSVVIGAFAAHGLKHHLGIEALGWIDTGVQYQQLHSLGLILIAIIWHQHPSWNGLKWSAGCMAAGIIFFSGSLYTMAASDIRAFGMVTPIGGVAFLISWSLLAITAWRGTHNDRNT